MRDSRLDNAKGVLIFLVVFGHFVEAAGGWSNPLFGVILTGIYMFHMPAFIFLAGMTARSEGLGQRIATLVILLFSFQALYLLVVTLKVGDYSGSWLQPYWLLWFLLSLIWWSTFLPVIKRIPFALGISALIAVAAGSISAIGYALSSARTLVFLPFFVAGVLFGRPLYANLRVSGAKRYFALLLIPALASGLHAYGVTNFWYYGSFRFDQLQVDDATGWATRGVLISAAAIASLAFFVALPHHETVFSKAGRNSLSVFLLHGFCVITLGPSITGLVKQAGPWLGIGVLLSASALLVAVLSADFLDTAIRRSANALYGWWAKVVRCFI
ncbi:Acyltransferase family protein [compost metagenome]